MKTKSRKLNSLPADLRGVADELLADKFPEPEVVEKKQPTPSGRTLEFPYTDMDVISNLANTVDFSTATTTYKTQAKSSIIDEHSLERLQRYRGMSNQHQLTLHFSIRPIGQFPTNGMDNHQMIQQLFNESIELVVNGDQIQYVEAHLHERLKALEVLYQGYLHCRLEREDVRVTNGYNTYPY
jgi:hypothetical protein